MIRDRDENLFRVASHAAVVRPRHSIYGYTGGRSWWSGVALGSGFAPAAENDQGQRQANTDLAKTKNTYC
jgi:hypothetical protein